MVVVATTGAFTNVPRRRRSAGAAGTGVHGADAAEGASCKEQPSPSSSSSSRSGVAEHVDQAEKQAEDPAPAAQNDGGDLRCDVAPAAPSRNDDGAAAPPPPVSSEKEAAAVPPSSSSSAAASRVRDAEELRRIKGKMLAPDQSLPERPIPRTANASAAPPPERPVKLLGDAIRCHGHGNDAAFAAASKPSRTAKSSSSKKRKDRGAAFWFGMGGEGQSTSSAGSDLDVTLDRLPVASYRLRDALSGLGVAAPPVRVYGKMMSRSDRATQQARLLLSCKSWRSNDGDDGPPFPLAAFMTDEELAVVHGPGLPVLAYDRDGNKYDAMKCRYLDSNVGYRLIGHWGKFLRRNGLVDNGAAKRAMDVLVDLWLFRTPEGKLGIVLMHYRKGDAEHADAAFADDEVRVRKNTRRQPAVEVDSAAEDDDGMETEDEDVGEVNDVAMHDDAAGGNVDVVMEDAAHDAAGGGEASSLPSSDAIGVTLVLEVTGSQEEATVPLALSDAREANNVKAGKKDAPGPGKTAAPPSPPHAGGAYEEGEAAAQGQPASPSLFNADDAKVVEVHAPPSSDAGAKEEETAEQGRAGEPVSSLSGYKQEVLEAAKTLMLISQGFW